MNENLKLCKELEEAKKENEFLKKRQHSSHGKSISSISVYKGKQGRNGIKMTSEAV